MEHGHDVDRCLGEHKHKNEFATLVASAHYVQTCSIVNIEDGNAFPDNGWCKGKNRLSGGHVSFKKAAQYNALPWECMQNMCWRTSNYR